MQSNADFSEETQSAIAALNSTLQDFITQLAEVRGERSPRMGPSVSNPGSDGPETYRRYPVTRRNTREQDVKPATEARHLKPASPSDFDGDRTKGRTFLNSCELYVTLAPHQFADDQAKIMWAFSF